VIVRDDYAASRRGGRSDADHGERRISTETPERRDRARLTKAQRELSRKAKGSANREKARRRVARVHARIADRRRDFLHKAADQFERTLLSWRRTALSLVAAGLLVAHVAGRGLGPVGLAVTLMGTAGSVAFVWLGHERRIAATGLALVLGVLLLGVVAIVGVTTG